MLTYFRLTYQSLNCTYSISYAAQNMKLSIQDFFSKRDQIHSFLRIWSNLLKKSLMENFIFVQGYMTIACIKYLYYAIILYYLKYFYSIKFECKILKVE